MANVLNRNNLSDYRVSVNTPDFDPADWVVNPDLSAVSGLDSIYWKLDGDSVLPMTEEEQGAVDLARLPSLIEGQLAVLDTETNDFVNEHYPPHRQRTLTALLSEARFAGLTNRANYILQALGWIDAVLTYFYGVYDAIENAATPAELDAITWDYSALAAADPLVTIYQARLIQD